MMTKTEAIQRGLPVGRLIYYGKNDVVCLSDWDCWNSSRGLGTILDDYI